MDVVAVTQMAKLISRVSQLTEEDHLSTVLVFLAGSDGRAAAQAINDAGRSDFPREQILAAATLLRSSHQKYLDRVNRRRWFDGKIDGDYKYGALPTPDARQSAAFHAGLTALALSGLFKALGDRRQQEAWLQRSHDNFIGTYRLFVPLATNGLSSTFNSVSRTPTDADEQDYRRRCDSMLDDYEEICAILA